MAANRKREMVRFQRRTAVSDGLGNVNEGPLEPLCGPFHARLRPINGREEVLAQKLSGVQPFELVVNYCAATAGVQTADVAVNTRTGALYDITAIQNPDERKRELSMIVKAGKPAVG
jgi:head-tail adaptor